MDCDIKEVPGKIEKILACKHVIFLKNDLRGSRAEPRNGAEKLRDTSARLCGRRAQLRNTFEDYTGRLAQRYDTGAHARLTGDYLPETVG